MSDQSKPIIIVQVDAAYTKAAAAALNPVLGEGYRVPPLNAQTNTVETLIYPYNEPVAAHYLADVLEGAGLASHHHKVVIHNVPFDHGVGPL
ncbi:hypothetical protein ACTG16_23510 [Aeromonas sp. 23P]|uniref:hypothetical protein n=1 Tax=Aeromonas sp. 23P TaxID=3452716 RepID=UPI003F7A131D